MQARLALGTAQLGMRYGIANTRGRPDARRARAVLARALDAGVEWLDTAPAYGDAEAVVGRFLKSTPRARALRICTKLPALPPQLPGGAVRRVAQASLERSRRTLGRDTIDLYLLHGPADLGRHGAALEESLQEFRRRGWIRRYGVSVYAPDEARRALARGFAQGIQYPFNLMDRRFVTSGCVELLRKAGALTFARSPLLQGLLGMPATRLPRTLAAAREYLRRFEKLLQPHGFSAATAAIAYAAQQSGARWLVAGAETPQQVDELAAALQLRLPRDLVAQLNRRMARVPARVRDPRCWTAAA